MNQKLQNEIREMAREEVLSILKEAGIERTELPPMSRWLSAMWSRKYIRDGWAIKGLDELIEKFAGLCKHLGIEYYKKEVKETNGDTKNYVEEGFRKIKKSKNKIK